MAKKDFSQAFASLGMGKVFTAKIKALDGAEIEYRKLTMDEADTFAKRLVKDYGEDGVTPSIDFDEANKIKYEKASLILVSPEMSVEDLRALPASAAPAIAEINGLIAEDEDMYDEEGNSNDSAKESTPNTK